jgi:hypothetical protein
MFEGGIVAITSVGTLSGTFSHEITTTPGSDAMVITSCGGTPVSHYQLTMTGEIQVDGTITVDGTETISDG